MKTQRFVSRRRFLGGLAAISGYYGIRGDEPLFAQVRQGRRDLIEGSGFSRDGYDNVAKLAFNENPFGPSKTVIEAMTQAFQYANRYAAPDGGIVEAIAAQDGVDPANILLGAGSTEILELCATTFLTGRKKVIGVEPTFSTVFEFATGLDASAIRLPLGSDFRQDIPAMIKVSRDHSREVGLIYLCNPNNPTGVVVRKSEVIQLLDGIPENVPVLVDEAYHHFVEDPGYSTSITQVLEGRPVIVARTFSKIAALAGLRLGYAVAPDRLMDQMRRHAGIMHVNILARWAGAASLKDGASQTRMRNAILESRKKTTAELAQRGFKVIPSEANFFMVDLARPVGPVIQEFRQRNILVGRPFPPLFQHLRVSIGTPDEMTRFLTAFKEIVG